MNDYAPPLLLDSIQLKEKLPTDYTLNESVKGVEIDSLDSLSRQPYIILAEWCRDPEPGVWGSDKIVKDLQDEYDNIQTCLGVFLQFDSQAEPRTRLGNTPLFVSEKRTPEWSDLFNNGSVVPEAEKRLFAIPDVSFEIYITWYHRLDGWLYDKSFTRQLYDIVEYTPRSFRSDFEMPLDAVNKGIKQAIGKSHSDCLYLMQLERWRRYNNPV